MHNLPEIPGGWTVQEIDVEGCTLRITLPAAPDAFLDDTDVLAASRRDDYMPYWPYLWSAANSMAKMVARAGWPPGTRVLEIGAGIGLVGLAALSRGLRVTFSDYQQTAVELGVHNARQNGFGDAEGILLDWREPPSQRFPVILGCDVVYETRSHKPILDFVDSVLSEGGICWFGDPGRQHARAFIDQARERHFSVDLRDETGRRLREPHVGKFQLILLGKGPFHEAT